MQYSFLYRVLQQMMHQQITRRRRVAFALFCVLTMLVGCAAPSLPQRGDSAAGGIVAVPPAVTSAAATTMASITLRSATTTTTPLPPVVVVPETTAAPKTSATPHTALADSSSPPPTEPTAEPTPTASVAPEQTPTDTTAPSTATPTDEPTISANGAPQKVTVVPQQAAVPMLPSPTLPALDEEGRGARFDDVWNAVEQKYLYRDFHGLDWAAIRDEYRPQALAAPSSEAFYAVIKAMIERLADRHSRYLTPQEAQQQKAVTGGADAAYVGIGTLDTNGLVLGVFADSPAAEAGLRRRDRIVAVDDKPFGTPGASLNGPEGSTVRLEVVSPGQPSREVVVERDAIVARLLPDAYRLEGTNVGYLAVQWLWSEDMGAQVATALDGLLADGPLDGLIIDLRANRGGWRTVLEQTLASFFEGEAGEFFRSDAAYPLAVNANDVYPRLAQTPMVVLVDGDTQSYAEVLAASLQAAGRAVVVGTPTPGNTETIFGYDFDDGSRLWLAQEGFRLPSGQNLEGRGVMPDAIVDVDWTTFSDADDPQIVKALELLNRSPKE